MRWVLCLVCSGDRFLFEGFPPSEVMTVYRIRDRRIINTLVWFLLPYSLNMITAYCYRQHHITACGTVGICIMFVEMLRSDGCWGDGEGYIGPSASESHFNNCVAVFLTLSALYKETWSCCDGVFIGICAKCWLCYFSTSVPVAIQATYQFVCGESSQGLCNSALVAS